MHPPGVKLTTAQRLLLKAARKDRTQTEVAEAIGVQPQHLSQVESGKKRPSYELLTKLTGELGLKIELRIS